MSEAEVQAILRRLDELTSAFGELKAEVQAVQAWQTVRDRREHDAAVTRAAYWRIVRYGIAVARSPISPWLCAGAGVAWATLR